MLKIGLTGGVASGKSTVTRLFENLGAPVVDTDVLAREVVEPGEPGLAALCNAFGQDVLAEDGRLDRRKLRSIVFADDEKRRRLEALLHPLIRSRLLAELGRLDAAYVIIAVPLLIETDFVELVDRVLVVDATADEQLARLMTRDGSTPEEAKAMIAAQTTREARLAAADDIIDNSGDLAATAAQVETLHRRYLQLATVCR